MPVYKPDPDSFLKWWQAPIEPGRYQNILDPRMPLRTRDGRPAFWAVEPYGFDPREEWAVRAAINHPRNNPREFAANGSFYNTGEPHPSDLFNVPLRTWLAFKSMSQRSRLRSLNEQHGK